MLIMPLRREGYRDMERYRRTRNEQRKRYYDKTAGYQPRKWTAEEEVMVLAHIVTDTELSKRIQRSVRAIQVHRCKLKKQSV